MIAAVSSDRCDRLGIDQVEPCADNATEAVRVPGPAGARCCSSSWSARGGRPGAAGRRGLPNSGAAHRRTT